MEQVFDLREFIVMLVKKGKYVILAAVIFGVLGACYGFIRFPKEDKIMSTSTATVNLADVKQDATALNNAMTMTNSYVVSDTFYTEMINELSQVMGADKLKKLFGGDSTPKLEDIKQVLKIQTKGNIIIVDVTATDKDIPAIASELSIKYIVDTVPKFNEKLTAKRLGNEITNVTLQNNDSALKEAIKFGILGFGGGMVLAILIIFFVDIFDLKVKNADQLKRYKLNMLGESYDRSVAAIKTALQDKPLVVAVCSTASLDVIEIAKEFKEAFARVSTEVSIQNCTGKSEAEAVVDSKEIAKNGATIICCDNINKSTAAMYYVAEASGLVLCERVKQSRTDEIENALDLSNSLDTKVVWCHLQNKQKSIER